MQRHGVGNVKRNDLGNDRAVGHDSGGRKAVLTGKRLERRLEHIAAGGAADTAIHAQRRFLMNGVPARLGIVAIELAAEQRTKVRELKFLEEFGVLSHRFADSRQDPHRDDHVIDSFFQMRREHGQARPAPVASDRRAVQRKTSLEGLHKIGRHDG